MVKYAIFCCLYLLYSFFGVKTVFGASIVLNELLPHPSTGSDWVELFNTLGQSVNITNWQLKDSAASPMKTLSGAIDPGGYLVVDVGTRLNNGGDTITLADTNGASIDSYQYTADPGIGKTLGRSPNGAGGFSVLSSVTKGSANDVSQTAQPTDQSSQAPIATSTAQSSPVATTPPPLATNVHLSEFLPNPPAGEQEWVELYNADPAEAYIGGLKIDDIDGGSSPYTIPSEGNTTFIPPLAYKVIILSSAKFNNSGDTVRLLKPDNSVVEETGYDKTDQNVAWAKDGTSWRKTTIPTPGEANRFSAANSSSSDSSPTPAKSTPTNQTTKPQSGSVLSANDNRSATKLAIVGSPYASAINDTLPELALSDSPTPLVQQMAVKGIQPHHASVKVIQYGIGTLLMVLALVGYFLFRQCKVKDA